MYILNEELKFNTIITNTKHLEELVVDVATAIRNITNSEDKSYLQVCNKIIGDNKPLAILIANS